MSLHTIIIHDVHLSRLPMYVYTLHCARIDIYTSTICKSLTWVTAELCMLVHKMHYGSSCLPFHCPRHLRHILPAAGLTLSSCKIEGTLLQRKEGIQTFFTRDAVTSSIKQPLILSPPPTPSVLYNEHSRSLGIYPYAYYHCEKPLKV